MAVKFLKPISNATRKMSMDDFADITKKKPEKSLVVPLKKKSGRNAQGKITVRHRGGGAKRKYRIIDFRMNGNVEGTITAIEYDPNRNARIALVQKKEGGKFYMIAPKGARVGKKIIAGENADARVGNRMALKDIPVGTVIFNVELTPGKGGQLARSAGTKVQLMAKEGKYVQVKLPSGEQRLVDETCLASIGEVSNAEHKNIKVGKAGRKRHMGIRPTVRGKAMNPVDHPHGGGEGGHSISPKHPKTPWGKPTLGFKTRNRKAKSSKMIVRGRKR